MIPDWLERICIGAKSDLSNFVGPEKLKASRRLAYDLTMFSLSRGKKRCAKMLQSQVSHDIIKEIMLGFS